MISSDQCFLETTNEQCGQKRFQLLHFVEYGGRCIQQICKKSCWPVLEMLTTTAWHMPTKSANRKHGRRLKPTFSHTQYDFLAINHRCPQITIGFCLVKLVYTQAVVRAPSSAKFQAWPEPGWWRHVVGRKMCDCDLGGGCVGVEHWILHHSI